ncbi:PREDICTED: protein SPT2 homolog [Dinoponera quadriceps]|uniref:Protein SPT2 homolog n=1 Tax=Dinoponera quadriceps TaxID=609295 RepID=A0A6P3X6F3_DINQU|nr:PREDICTED: protein SPT2 homolog [Dinoponera quadriceps]
MDFNDLLSVAQKNKGQKQAVPCYQTKFTPLKKQVKQSKTLSENIKKFLARKEEEEKQKALEEKKKKENLLALRDRKAQSRINKHLKVCKSANKSVLADAIDNDNTAITIAGPSQPDEDDYGYVSQEAAAFYNQLMDKYSKLPPEKPIFSNTEKKTINDIASTKDRLKQAFKQQELGGSDGHRRRKKVTALDVREPEADEKTEVNKIKEEDEKPKLKKKSLPPPLHFAELLKLAEKKQHEPVYVEVKPKVEESRPMTKRQQQEYIKEKERKEQREKNPETVKKLSVVNTPSKPTKTQSNNILKASEKPPNPVSDKNILRTTLTIPKKINNKSNGKHNSEKTDLDKSKNDILEERKKLEAERRQLEDMRRVIEEEKKKLAQKQEDVKSQVKFSNKVSSKLKVADKQIPYKGVKPRQLPPADLKLHSSLANDKPKQLPPPDIKSMKHKQIVKKLSASNKRRICDDDEDEYDSDMNDFIDDGPEEDNEDYSRYISEIFGYDKNKYKQVDDEDDTAMESNFAQQLKEEYVSTKIGIMEDLEDMRIEALEKKRKEEERRALLTRKKMKK